MQTQAPQWTQLEAGLGAVSGHGPQGAVSGFSAQATVAAGLQADHDAPRLAGISRTCISASVLKRLKRCHDVVKQPCLPFRNVGHPDVLDSGMSLHSEVQALL